MCGLKSKIKLCLQSSHRSGELGPFRVMIAHVAIHARSKKKVMSVLVLPSQGQLLS